MVASSPHGARGGSSQSAASGPGTPGTEDSDKVEEVIEQYVAGTLTVEQARSMSESAAQVVRCRLQALAPATSGSLGLADPVLVLCFEAAFEQLGWEPDFPMERMESFESDYGVVQPVPFRSSLGPRNDQMVARWLDPSVQQQHRRQALVQLRAESPELIALMKPRAICTMPSSS